MYILRLLAGKFGPICTEFPLTTFSAKILTKFSLKFPAKIKLDISRAKKIAELKQIEPLLEKKLRKSEQLPFRFFK